MTLFVFAQSRKGQVSDDWLAYSPDGFYYGSPGVERYLAWRVGDELKSPSEMGAEFERPDRIEAALSGRVRER